MCSLAFPSFQTTRPGPAEVLLIILGLALASPPLVAIEQTWQPSTLSEKTLKKVDEAVLAYQKCLNDETRQHLKDPEDSRRVTDLILNACDGRLAPIKPAFRAEKVPDPLAERYLRRKRSQAAQQVLRVVMAEQALRHRETTP
jgi:hypothetical protein